jgi:hypothetical protein
MPTVAGSSCDDSNFIATTPLAALPEPDARCARASGARGTRLAPVHTDMSTQAALIRCDQQADILSRM